MQLTEYVREIAVTEAKRVGALVGDGCKGIKCPLPISGWFIHLDGKGAIREFTYELDGIVVRYNA